MRALDLEAVENGKRVLSEPLQRIGRLRRAGLAVSALVVAHDAEFFRQVLRLLIPHWNWSRAKFENTSTGPFRSSTSTWMGIRRRRWSASAFPFDSSMVLEESSRRKRAVEKPSALRDRRAIEKPDEFLAAGFRDLGHLRSTSINERGLSAPFARGFEQIMRLQPPSEAPSAIWTASLMINRASHRGSCACARRRPPSFAISARRERRRGERKQLRESPAIGLKPRARVRALHHAERRFRARRAEFRAASISLSNAWCLCGIVDERRTGAARRFADSVCINRRRRRDFSAADHDTDGACDIAMRSLRMQGASKRRSSFRRALPIFMPFVRAPSVPAGPQIEEAPSPQQAKSSRPRRQCPNAQASAQDGPADLLHATSRAKGCACFVRAGKALISALKSHHKVRSSSMTRVS